MTPNEELPRRVAQVQITAHIELADEWDGQDESDLTTDLGYSLGDVGHLRFAGKLLGQLHNVEVNVLTFADMT